MTRLCFNCVTQLQMYHHTYCVAEILYREASNCMRGWRRIIFITLLKSMLGNFFVCLFSSELFEYSSLLLLKRRAKFTLTQIDTEDLPKKPQKPT